MLSKLLKEKYGNRADIIKVVSAGIYAFADVAPPPNAIRAAGDFDVDLSRHKSKAIHLTMMESADVVFCMTSRQKSHLISRFPWFEDKIHILKKYAYDPHGEKSSTDLEDEMFDIPDPIGHDLEVYHRVYGDIKEALETILNRWEEEQGLRKKMAVSLKIAVASDHAGFSLKKLLADFLKELGHEVRDFGAYGDDKSVDYPDFARPAAQSVANGENDYGILVCGSGVGVSIVANKVKGVRALPCQDVITARLSRAHNDANVLCIGERITTPTMAQEIIKEWLSTPFEGGRHEQRVKKIDNP
ncbi:MAG: ribose 5-phosphate isomerase B [Firmicutes bacterium]|nr:ribose 5-phosphate isomerase B [Bacillota bacterium]